MKIHTLFAALLLMSLSFVGCADDTDTTNNSSSHHNGTDTRPEDAGDASTPDGSSDPGDADTGADGDASAPDTDASPDQPDADTGDDVDSGPSCVADRDCDYDGLTDCEEEQLGTDTCAPDTDDDKLTDPQEILEGTDPLNPDTDGDCVEDGREIDLGLDPTDPESFDDGVNDCDRWIVNACEDPSAEPVNFRTNNHANWRVALPPTFNNTYSELTIAGASNTNMHAAATYDDPTNEVAGYLLSARAGSYQSPNDALDTYQRHVESLGDLRQRNVGGHFQTHDYRTAAIRRFKLETPTTRTVKQVREDLLNEMANSFAMDVSGLPSTSGASYDQFRIFVSVIHREYENGSRQLVTSVAVSPEQKFRSRERVEFRMNDLTNTTNIASANDENLVRCDLEQSREHNNVDFYWVLDQSGSMDVEYGQVQAVANQFYNGLNNTDLDYRLGVTSMDINYGGRLRAGWHTSLSTFLSEIDWVIECDKRGYTGPDPCSAGLEHGLRSAKEGIEFMKGISGNPGSDRIRQDAELITIWMSDEEDQSIKNAGGLGTVTGQQTLSNFISFFERHTVGFSIVGEGNGCGELGEGYQRVALQSSGSHASICDSNVSETIEDIIHTAVRLTGYELPDTPISSSLRVYINGEWVPRSREDGFDYFSETNSIAFFGTHRPTASTGPGDAPDYISISYETFMEGPKEEQPAQDDDTDD